MIGNQSGLTLTELLVVAAIIMVLSAVTIPNWNRGGERLKVIRSAYQLNQDIRRAQELTLANAACESCPGPNCDSVHGYGLHFNDDSQSYVLFGDCNGNDHYERGRERKEQIKLEQGVKVNDLIKKEAGTELHPSSLMILFKPPEPRVVMHDQDGDQAIVEVGNGYCQKIRTNKVGLVEINDCD